MNALETLGAGGAHRVAPLVEVEATDEEDQIAVTSRGVPSIFLLSEGLNMGDDLGQLQRKPVVAAGLLEGTAGG